MMTINVASQVWFLPSPTSWDLESIYGRKSLCVIRCGRNSVYVIRDGRQCLYTSSETESLCIYIYIYIPSQIVENFCIRHQRWKVFVYTITDGRKSQ